jgi:hypothetical protein
MPVPLSDIFPFAVHAASGLEMVTKLPVAAKEVVVEGADFVATTASFVTGELPQYVLGSNEKVTALLAAAVLISGCLQKVAELFEKAPKVRVTGALEI